MPSAPGASVPADATPSWLGSQTGREAKSALGESVATPVAVPSGSLPSPSVGLGSGSASPALPSLSRSVGSAVRRPGASGPVSSPLPPWACSPCPAMAGRAADGPSEVATWTKAGTAVPINRAAAAAPTTACRRLARRAGTARWRWSRVPSEGASSRTAPCSMRRRATSSSSSEAGAPRSRAKRSVSVPTRSSSGAPEPEPGSLPEPEAVLEPEAVSVSLPAAVSAAASAPVSAAASAVPRPGPCPSGSSATSLSTRAGGAGSGVSPGSGPALPSCGRSGSVCGVFSGPWFTIPFPVGSFSCLCSSRCSGPLMPEPPSRRGAPRYPGNRTP